MTRVWRGSDSDSVPNPKFESGSFCGPKHRIRIGSGTQEPDSARFARPHDRIRFGWALISRVRIRFGDRGPVRLQIGILHPNPGLGAGAAHAALPSPPPLHSKNASRASNYGNLDSIPAGSGMPYRVRPMASWRVLRPQ